MLLIEILNHSIDLEEEKLLELIDEVLNFRINERMIKKKSKKPTNHLPSVHKEFSTKKELKW